MRKIYSITEVQEKLAELTRYQLQVGIIGDSKRKDNPESDMTNVKLGLIHEFGSRKMGIPERSFLRTTYYANKQNIYEKIARAIRRSINQDIEFEYSLGLIGRDLVKQMGAKFTDGSFVPLKKETILKKGSATPLIDTGELRKSITYNIITK